MESIINHLSKAYEELKLAEDIIYNSNKDLKVEIKGNEIINNLTKSIDGRLYKVKWQIGY